MARQKEFVNYLLELLQPLGNVTAKAMFGGHGIYKDGLILGIVFDDTLYLKADDVSRGEFDERGLRPFVFESKARGKQASIGYYQCPEDALESAVLMVEWAKTAYGAALRATAKKKGVNKRATEASAKTVAARRHAPGKTV